MCIYLENSLVKLNLWKMNLLASESPNWGQDADKRVWKTVESQGNVIEKSGNFEILIEWQPWNMHGQIFVI